MANHKSALKKNVRDEKKRVINKMNRTKMKNKIKFLIKKLEAGELEEAKKVFPDVLSRIDKTISHGTIHKKTGSRYKSRLTLRVRKAGIEI
ncbi:MAG: 30S ribosomal protein S20 [bacterium]|nr:30S ribosomal protein S20 [bacterium]